MQTSRTTKIPTPTHEDWLAARRPRITSTRSAAILGASAHQTPLDVFLEITGRAEPDDLSLNERVFWGSLLEDIIAKGMAERYGLEVQRFKRFLARTDFDGRVASWFDYLITGADSAQAHTAELRRVTEQVAQLVEAHGPGLMEIKNVDEAPAVDYVRDYTSIDLLNGQSDPRAAIPEELQAEVEELAEKASAAAEAKKAAEADEKAAKTRIKEILGTSERAAVDGFNISYKSQSAKPYTQADVEEVREKLAAGAAKRAGQRQLRITKKKRRDETAEAA